MKKSRSAGAKTGAARGRRKSATSHPGSKTENAVGKGDFGIPADAPRAELDYVSNNTKHSDPGAAQAADFEEDGVRDHGVGGPASGPGSSTGGDLDVDVIGVGTGGAGLAISGPDHVQTEAGTHRADEATGGSDQSHRARKPLTEVPQVHGTTFSRDVEEDDVARGSDAATSSHTSDDSFAGEVSRGDARGEDDSD